MNHKTLAIILVVLLGGMAVYYNQSTADNASVDHAPKIKNNK